MRNSLFVLILLAGSVTVNAHEYMNFDELSSAFGWDFERAEVRSEEAAPGIHVLFGVGGNVLVSIGDQGTLMVDSQFAQMIPKLENAVRELGGERIDFTINTHWHFDHADGNPVLGRDGTWIVAQANSRRMVAGEHP
ncbi:MAG: MBL fold metallo-hydrolase, partial [Gammaproteobacteria bacterium]|nr:MBL fold metallo-hydrolase [Gammaproteobacteria bacterium]